MNTRRAVGLIVVGVVVAFFALPMVFDFGWFDLIFNNGPFLHQAPS